MSKLNFISLRLQDSMWYATKIALDAAYSKFPQSGRPFIGFPCDLTVNASPSLCSNSTINDTSFSARLETVVDRYWFLAAADGSSSH